MHRLNEADWIALRLLYLMLAADPSAGALPDVYKTLEYYGKKLRKRGSKPHERGSILPVFALLNRDSQRWQDIQQPGRKVDARHGDTVETRYA
jgi:hypothetical protein